MTDAERQARYRAARSGGQPVIRFRRPADHRGRAKRWSATVDVLVQLGSDSILLLFCDDLALCS